MSSLRKQFEAARAEYRSSRYPGDLAARTLGSGARKWLKGLITLGAAGAIAAVLMIALRARPAAWPAPSPAPQLASTSPVVAPAPVTQPASESQPLEMVPTYQAMTFPSMPLFPTMDSLQESSSTTKESV